MKITNEQLAAIVYPAKYTKDKLNLTTNAINQTMEKYQINTALRASHFLAQTLHESGAFRYSVEIWGNIPAQRAYDTRVDLGNTPQIDGDGYKYRGRGWIQLTGKNNYRLLSKEFNVDFVSNPDLVAQEPYNSLSAGWYWNKRKLNIYADKDDVVAITKLVNGGYNGLNERRGWLGKAEKVLVKSNNETKVV